MNAHQEVIIAAARAAAAAFAAMDGAAGWRWSGSNQGLHVPGEAEIALTISELVGTVEIGSPVSRMLGGETTSARTGRLSAERIHEEDAPEPGGSVRISLELGQVDR